MIKTDYTREELIKICERAFVSEDKWHDRDSSDAQCQLGICYTLLKDGCEYEIDIDNCSEDTIVIDIYSKGFCWFESFTPVNERNREDKQEHNYMYLPTEKRLDEAKGEDWY